MKETFQRRDYLTGLRNTLVERFSEEDLRTLCSDLRIDYDDLPAKGRANKARELINHLDRRERLPELIQIGKKLRPDVAWEGTPEVATQVSDVVQKTQPEQEPIRIIVDVVVKVLVSIVIVALIWVVYRQTALETSGFAYLVRVQDSITGDYIQDADVTIEVPGKVPLDDTTDVKGIAAITIDSSYTEQPGRLIVEGSGYTRYEQLINLTPGGLPDIVQLEQEHLTSRLTPTHTPTPTPTRTPTPTPTFTPTPTSTPGAVVISDSLNLRAGCGTGYQAWAYYPQKTALNVLGRAAGAEWLKVETPDGRTGWMHAQYLQVNVPLVDVPIAACTFQDFEPDNGTPPGGGNYFWDAWFTTCSFTSTIIYEGSRSVRVDAHAGTNGSPTDTGGTMGINPCSSDPVDLSSATTIYVWVYDTVGDNTVELKLRDFHEAVSTPVWSAMQSVQDEWTKIEWALSDFTGIDMHQVKNLEIYEWNDGIYYFDNAGWQ